MSIIMTFVFIFSLLTSDVLADRNGDYDYPQQDGKSFFLLGGIIRRIKSRWQNQNLPPSPYGGGPIFTGYYECGFYNCRPPQFQVFQSVQSLPPVPAVQPLPPVIQTPVVVQQAQVYQPNTFAQAVAQPNPNPVYPVQPPQQPQQLQYPAQPTYGSPQPYQPYPVYPSAYASPVPGQIYQNAGCVAYPGYLCGRKT